MSDTIRGSDKLKQACCEIRNLSPEEINAVAGGASISGSAYAYFPKGIPWPDIFGSFNVGGISQPVLTR